MDRDRCIDRILDSLPKNSKQVPPVGSLWDPVFDQSITQPADKYHPDGPIDFRPASGDGK